MQLLSFFLNVWSFFIPIEKKIDLPLTFLTHFGLCIEKLLLLYFDFVMSPDSLFKLFLVTFLPNSFVFSKYIVISTANNNPFFLFHLTIFISGFSFQMHFQNGSLLFSNVELGLHGDLVYSSFYWPMPITLSSLRKWCWGLTELHHFLLE